MATTRGFISPLFCRTSSILGELKCCFLTRKKTKTLKRGGGGLILRGLVVAGEGPGLRDKVSSRDNQGVGVKSPHGGDVFGPPGSEPSGREGGQEKGWDKGPVAPLPRPQPRRRRAR